MEFDKPNSNVREDNPVTPITPVEGSSSDPDNKRTVTFISADKENNLPKRIRFKNIRVRRSRKCCIKNKIANKDGKPVDPNPAVLSVEVGISDKVSLGAIYEGFAENILAKTIAPRLTARRDKGDILTGLLKYDAEEILSNKGKRAPRETTLADVEEFTNKASKEDLLALIEKMKLRV